MPRLKLKVGGVAVDRAPPENQISSQPSPKPTFSDFDIFREQPEQRLQKRRRTCPLGAVSALALQGLLRSSLVKPPPKKPTEKQRQVQSYVRVFAAGSANGQLAALVQQVVEGHYAVHHTKKTLLDEVLAALAVQSPSSAAAVVSPILSLLNSKVLTYGKRTAPFYALTAAFTPAGKDGPWNHRLEACAVLVEQLAGALGTLPDPGSDQDADVVRVGLLAWLVDCLRTASSADKAYFMQVLLKLNDGWVPSVLGALCSEEQDRHNSSSLTQAFVPVLLTAATSSQSVPSMPSITSLHGALQPHSSSNSRRLQPYWAVLRRYFQAASGPATAAALRAMLSAGRESGAQVLELIHAVCRPVPGGQDSSSPTPLDSFWLASSFLPWLVDCLTVPSTRTAAFEGLAYVLADTDLLWNTASHAAMVPQPKDEDPMPASASAAQQIARTAGSADDASGSRSRHQQIAAQLAKSLKTLPEQTVQEVFTIWACALQLQGAVHMPMHPTMSIKAEPAAAMSTAVQPTLPHISAGAPALAAGAVAHTSSIKAEPAVRAQPPPPALAMASAAAQADPQAQHAACASPFPTISGAVQANPQAQQDVSPHTAAAWLDAVLPLLYLCDQLGLGLAASASIQRMFCTAVSNAVHAGQVDAGMSAAQQSDNSQIQSDQRDRQPPQLTPGMLERVIDQCLVADGQSWSAELSSWVLLQLLACLLAAGEGSAGDKSVQAINTCKQRICQHVRQLPLVASRLAVTSQEHLRQLQGPLQVLEQTLDASAPSHGGRPHLQHAINGMSVKAASAYLDETLRSSNACIQALQAVRSASKGALHEVTNRHMQQPQQSHGWLRVLASVNNVLDVVAVSAGK